LFLPLPHDLHRNPSQYLAKVTIADVNPAPMVRSLALMASSLEATPCAYFSNVALSAPSTTRNAPMTA